MNEKCMFSIMPFCFIVTCLFYSCNRADNIKVISQEGILISSRLSMGCPYDSYKDGIYRKYTVIDSVSNKVLAEFIETDTFHNNLRNITSGCYTKEGFERLYKNISNSISDPYLEWYSNRCLYCFSGGNKDLTNFLLTHQTFFKDQLVERLRYDEYSNFNDSIVTVLENSIYSPREYARLCKVDTFVSKYKKYKPPYRKDSIFPINILDIKTNNLIYFNKSYFFMYQQSYKAFQQAKLNRHKEGYFYKIRNYGFDFRNWHYKRDLTLLFNKIILTEQTILKNHLGQWGYNQRVLNPMVYAQRDIGPSGELIYTSNLEDLLSAPITEEIIIQAHKESERIRRQRKEWTYSGNAF
jgi:hypothetical protein